VRDDEPIVDAAVEDLAAAAAALPDDALPDTAQVDAPSFDAEAARSIADDLRDFPDDDGDDNVDAVEGSPFMPHSAGSLAGIERRLRQLLAAEGYTGLPVVLYVDPRDVVCVIAPSATNEQIRQVDRLLSDVIPVGVMAVVRLFLALNGDAKPKPVRGHQWVQVDICENAWVPVRLPRLDAEPALKPESERIGFEDLNEPGLAFIPVAGLSAGIRVDKSAEVADGASMFVRGKPQPDVDGTERTFRERHGWTHAQMGFWAHQEGGPLECGTHSGPYRLPEALQKAWNAGWAEREKQHGGDCDQRSPHEASEAGRRSLLFGTEISECPHKDPVLRRAWVWGWHAGRDEQLADLWERWLADGGSSNIRTWDMSPGPALMDVEQAKMGARAEVYIERQIKKMQELLPSKDPVSKVEVEAPTTPAPIADIEESESAKRTRRLSAWLSGWPQAALDAQGLGARITLTLDSDRDQ